MKKLVLCTCNGTLSKTIDYARVQKEVTKIYDSIEVMDSLCLEEGLKFLSESLSPEDRLVIGACSAQVIEIPVKQKIKSDLMHFVPLREQVTWVHAEKKSATNKAVVLLSDASTRLNYLEPTTEFSENMLNRVLIIGGGIAGLRAASDLGRLGVETVLLEPKKLGQKEYLESCQYMSNIDLLENTIQKLNDSIDGPSRVYGSVSKLDGQVGSFEVMISSSGGELLSEEYGAIIIATPP
ncbi:MAG: FAD-dependent oxidoreductase, partial [Promethearchaeota archaeon]